MEFNFGNIVSVFVVLFALIDAVGGIPIFVACQKNKEINALQAALYSFIIMAGFLFVGNWILDLFGVSVEAFAIAGSLVLFFISIEMIFGIEIFKNDDSNNNSATLVPIVFPLIAGPGTLTILLSMRAEYAVTEILIALLANMIIVYLVLKYLNIVKKIVGVGGIFILRKFFGIILMALSVKLFTSNIEAMF